MNPEKFARVKELFDRAVDLTEDERVAFLDRECADDPDVRAEVERLLAEETRETALGEIERAAEQARSPAKLPESIGGYRILGKLGEGGMGVVYEVEQSSPRRRVALKVIHRAVVSESMVRMFRREADSLGRLKHPGIGAIYESGVTGSGEHYFVMELVRGKTLSTWLRSRSKVPTPEELEHRLRLFRRIADAVHYAHQRGVIHRDLKPSNIIVTEPDRGNDSTASGDRVPRVKVLDFGLARITDTDVAASTMTTEAGVIKGTLQYMSPEQARGDSAEIDTRADVYALGVILYEMIAGRRPYEIESLLQAVRVICEQSPEPLGESWSGTRRLDADVETIVHRALEKEPERRYASAAALSEEIERYLGSLPILARPPSAVYQLRKFAGRNRALVGGVAATLVVLVAAIITSTVFGANEVVQRREAVAARDDLETVVDFQSSMLSEIDPQETGRKLFAELRARVAEAQRRRGASEEEIESVIGSLDGVLTGVNATDVARWVLDENVLAPAVRTLETEFGDRPLIEARLQGTIGFTYRRLALYEQAVQHELRALGIRRRELGEEHPETLRSMNRLAVLHQYQGRYDETERLYLERLEIVRHSYGDDHRDTLAALRSLAYLYVARTRHDEAEALYVEALDSGRRAHGDEDPDTLVSMSDLAGLYRTQGRYDDAERLYVETLESRRRVLGEDHQKTLFTLIDLAGLYEAQGRYGDAELHYLEALERAHRAFGDESFCTRVVMYRSGVFYYDRGRHDEASKLFGELLEVERVVLGESNPTTQSTMSNLAMVYVAQGRYEQAESLRREALEERRKALGDDHPATLRLINNMGFVLQARGKQDEAESHFLEALEGLRRVQGDDHPDVAAALIALGGLRNEQRRFTEAESLLREALEIRRAAFPAGDWQIGEAMSHFGASLTGQRRFEEAERLVVESQDLMRSSAAPVKKKREALERVALLYDAWGRFDEAAKWRAMDSSR